MAGDVPSGYSVSAVSNGDDAGTVSGGLVSITLLPNEVVTLTASLAGSDPTECNTVTIVPVCGKPNS